MSDTKNGNNDDNGESSTEESSSHKTPLETPRVLTRNLIPSLTYGLDASDMLECYTLVRSAPLHGIANSTVTIQKSVLGIRFRPKQDVAALHVKKPMELTLEYGPLRVGQDLNDEVMPIVQIEEASSYLSWDNVGKVYFTRKIVKENYLSSYYMASMTGAVLDELLLEAVKYTERRKLYQPFAVYSAENGRELRSSSSSDFTWFVWQHLARLGVEVDPILPPPIYEARLWVDSITKVIPEPAIAHKATIFYQKLYSCLEAIATKNYASFEDATLQPSSSPSMALSSDDDPENDVNENNGDRHPRRLEEHDTNSTPTSHEEKSQTPETQQPQENAVMHTPSPTGSQIMIPVSSPSATMSPTSLSPTSLPPTTLSPTLKLSSSPSEYVSEEPTVPLEEGGSGDGGTQTPPEPAKDAEKAKQAADEAQKAADEAKNAAQTEGETKAADAAQAAADAAHAAAAATSKAAAQSAMDNLLSGDGSLMSSIVTTCFTDPHYELGIVDENGTVTVDAFLYRDSAFYYELELVSPFIAVARINRPMPRTIYHNESGSGGDSLDWFLALSLAVTVLTMVLLICQQMGKTYIPAIARCQRWFFNPRKYDYEGNTVSGVQSGPMFFFGESGIPPSMGGRRSTYSPVHRKELADGNISDQMLFPDEEDDDFYVPSLHYQGNDQRAQLEIEMKSLSPKLHTTPPPARMGSSLHRSHSSTSLGSVEDDADVALEKSLPVPDRFFRDPNEVEMPSLKSKSRVAIPVGSNSSVASGNRSRSSSLNDAGHEDSFDL